MNKQLYFVEAGVLLNKTHPEFESYQIADFYEQFGFHDEHRLVFTTENKALKYAKNYVKTGINNTYAIVFSYVCGVDDEMLKEIKNHAYCDYCLEDPTVEDTTFFQYKTQYGLINTLIGEEHIC